MWARLLYIHSYYLIHGLCCFHVPIVCFNGVVDFDFWGFALIYKYKDFGAKKKMQTLLC